MNQRKNEEPGTSLAEDQCLWDAAACRWMTMDIQRKILRAREYQYDLIQTVQRAFEGHIWVGLGYRPGMEGWKAYCADNFDMPQIHQSGQARTDLIMGFDLTRISNRAIAALLGVSDMTVHRAVAKSGRSGKKSVRGVDGKKRSLSSNPMSGKERRAEIVRLHDEGMKQTDIAERLGVSQSTVSDTLKRHRERNNGTIHPASDRAKTENLRKERERLVQDIDRIRTRIEEIDRELERYGKGDLR